MSDPDVIKQGAIDSLEGIRVGFEKVIGQLVEFETQLEDRMVELSECAAYGDNQQFVDMWDGTRPLVNQILEFSRAARPSKRTLAFDHPEHVLVDGNLRVLAMDGRSRDELLKAIAEADANLKARKNAQESDES